VKEEQRNKFCSPDVVHKCLDINVKRRKSRGINSVPLQMFRTVWTSMCREENAEN